MKQAIATALAAALLLAGPTVGFVTPAKADFAAPPGGPPGGGSPPPAGSEPALTAADRLSDGQRFVNAAAICAGASVGTTIVLKGRLPRSGEAATITVQCGAVGVAAIAGTGWAYGVGGALLVDQVFFEGRLFGPLLNFLSMPLQPFFFWLDPQPQLQPQPVQKPKGGKKKKK